MQYVPYSFRLDTWQLFLNCHLLSSLISESESCPSYPATHFHFPCFPSSLSPHLSPVNYFNSLLAATLSAPGFSLLKSILTTTRLIFLKNIFHISSCHFSTPQKPPLAFDQIKAKPFTLVIKALHTVATLYLPIFWLFYVGTIYFSKTVLFVIGSASIYWTLTLCQA